MDLPIKSGAPTVVPLSSSTGRVYPFRWWPLYLLGFGDLALVVGV